jgi:N-acetylglucosaminyldiphosphoundecaprenol N-acetyl-beta-D-mannosaminyltransferase
MGTDERVSHSSPPSFRVLGVRVDAVQIPDTIAQMERWIEDGQGSRYITVTGMHGVTEAQHDPALRAIFNGAGLVVPDGMPLVWIGRLRGHNLRRRVYGPELMLTFCRQTARKGYRHFFYGGAAGVADKLAQTFADRFPGLEVAGTYSPPFRAVTAEEDAQIVHEINATRADVLWVGLSTPKQERWMHEHRDTLNVPVMIGVGAAFDFHTGRVKQAPVWMQEGGLEWFFRLLQEPRRLWHRYLVYGSKFIWWVSLETLRLSRFD